MVSRTRSGPGARPAVVWPVAMVLAAACAVSAALAADAEWRRILAAGCAAATVLLLARVLLLGRELAVERTQHASAAGIAAARGAEVAHLATVRVPVIAQRLRTGQRLDGAPGPLAPPCDTGEQFAGALASVVVALGSDEAVQRERALRDSVQAAFESVARNMHVMATVQQQVLDQVERSIDDPALMADVMKADHAASQMTRKAQTLLVMCGIWPARRETRPVSLYDCVRGAQSRIVEFGRIEVHGGQTLFVVPPAVEGLMHAVAELLENATVFSPSPSHVVVSVREVGAGAVVEIDDAGLGMPPDVLRNALGQLRDDLDLTRLGAVPRLGLACVGRWSRELGFNVELSGASAYGGTRAVMFVPFRLLTEPLSQLTADRRPEAEPTAPPPRPRPQPQPQPQAQPQPQPQAQPQPQPQPQPQHDDFVPADEASAPGRSTVGLPRRRSRRGSVPAAPQQSATRQQPESGSATPWTPEAARASIASVVSGTARGRAALDADETRAAQPPGPSAAPPPHGEQSLHSSPHKRDGGRS
ncbi:signal transduction histidine kinase [Streptomyces brevispora]|uniref:histidine kinase n=2 Tax=Streptomyces brevispora TaxID=887462 RepID=A0A561UQT4_9ACTN|nr:signal transduction histidine kinase [Streptomyces brevispora]